MTTTDVKKILFDTQDFIPKKIKIIKTHKKSENSKKNNKILDPLLVESIQNDIVNNESLNKINTENLQKEASYESIRLTNLPTHEDDFATKWFYGSQKETVATKIIAEFNVYNQVLEELEQEKIELPTGFQAKKIAYDLKKFILDDFNKNGVLLDTANNLIHRAFYSHCVKRAIDSIRQGEFTTPEGYKTKRPEIADILQTRINELLFEKLLSIKES